MSREAAVRATDFKSQRIYHSRETPGYTSWVSFFPGERGQWYITCEEAFTPKETKKRMSRDQWYEMSLPDGYDKSGLDLEMVILESNDDLQTWKVISRQLCDIQHSAGSFAQARTKDGRFIRFRWNCYACDPAVPTNEILYESQDNGATWKQMPAFHDGRFASYAHRLRTLRDGTLVLAIPLAPRWARGTERPIRAAKRLDSMGEMQMMLYFSHDQGRSWKGPLPIYAGQEVSETDFVELPSGDLLFINNSIFKFPGRQIVYREGTRFTPGHYQKVRFVEEGACVPETVCLTEDGVLVGCMRQSTYVWSDDLGQTWWNLQGAPNLKPEMYQPWINCLGDGQVACAGHYGADDAIGTVDQYLMIHRFRLETLHKTRETRIDLEREFDVVHGRYRNEYRLTLTCDGEPVPAQELVLTYFERYTPETKVELRLMTDARGEARASIPHLDAITDPNHQVYIVASFNQDNSVPQYKPAQTPQLMFYSRSHYPTSRRV